MKKTNSKTTMLKQFTLLLSLSLVLTSVIASSSPPSPLDAGHAGHRKMLKKRDLFGSLFGEPQPQASPAAQGNSGPVNVGQDPNQAQPSKSDSASAGSSATGKPTPSASATQTQDGGLGGIINTILSQSSASSPSASTSASSSASASSSTSTPPSSTSSLPPSTSSTPTPTQTPSQSISTQPGGAIVTVTSFSPSSESSAAPAKPVTGAVKVARNTIIILVAIGASIAGAAIIWTIIRKWKFRKSSSFEERLQPIDWQPAPGAGDMGDHDITEKLGRSASTRSHGSFTSGNGHTNAAPIDDLPSHDFTAGPSHLAPVGGYADLQRGPSPQPVMDYGYQQQQTQQYYNAPPATYQYQHQGGGYGGY